MTPERRRMIRKAAPMMLRALERVLNDACSDEEAILRSCRRAVARAKGIMPPPVDETHHAVHLLRRIIDAPTIRDAQAAENEAEAWLAAYDTAADAHRQIGSDITTDGPAPHEMTTERLRDEVTYISDYQG